jgi:DNA-binding transcriptional LysR family regulator
VDTFAQHGLEPRRAVEADQESIIANLVASGVGVSIAREEAAMAGVAAGRWVIWEPARISTTLWFVYPAREASHPVTKALIEVLSEVWKLSPQYREAAAEEEPYAAVIRKLRSTV